MLSLKSGKPIAKIDGGEHDGKTLYLNFGDKKDKKDKIDVDDPIDLLDEKILNKIHKMKNNKKFAKIRKMLKEEYENNSDSDFDSSDDEEYKDIIKNGKAILKDKQMTEFNIHEGSMKPTPNKETRQGVYVTGPSGSGKSTWIKNYAQSYKKIFPKNEVVLFSRLDEDESIDIIKPTRIEISEDLLNDKITPADLANTLTIFDDTDTIRNNKILKEIDSLKDDILQTGRHENVNVVVVSHLMSNYKQSRIVLNECQAIVFFPKCGNAYAINYVLNKYYGIDKKKVNTIMNLPSRWVYLYKNYPMFIIHDKGAFLL